MANKNTIKVRARRLRQAHQRKLDMLELSAKKDKLMKQRQSMVTVIGSTDMMKSDPWFSNYKLEFRSFSIYRIQGTTTCLCDHHLMFPEGNEITFDNVFNPTKCFSPEYGESLIVDFCNKLFCISNFKEFLDDLAELD